MNGYGIGYFLGILLVLALCAVVMYGVPILVASKMFRTTRVKTLGIVAFVYSLLSLVMWVFSMVTIYNTITFVLLTYFGLMVVNVIVTVACWLRIGQKEK